MEGGGIAAARPSIVRKESGGALAWNRGHMPFKVSLNQTVITALKDRMIYKNLIQQCQLVIPLTFVLTVDRKN